MYWAVDTDTIQGLNIGGGKDLQNRHMSVGWKGQRTNDDPDLTTDDQLVIVVNPSSQNPREAWVRSSITLAHFAGKYQR